MSQDNTGIEKQWAEKHFNGLYSVQDEVLRTLSGHFGPFYVTGGAALSRFYLNHRFTYDLDLTVSQLPCFHRKAAPVVDLLKTHFRVSDDSPAVSPRNFQLWTDGRDKLKISLSNDNFEQVGLPLMAGRVPVDNMLNMLVKKLKTIHDRDDPRDLFDIVSIASAYSFNWGDVLKHAQKNALLAQVNLLIQASHIACRFKSLWRRRESQDLFSLLGIPLPIGFNKIYLTAKIERNGNTSEKHPLTIEFLPRELKRAASRLKAISMSDCPVNELERQNIPSFFNLTLGGASIRIDIHSISVREKASKKFSKVPDALSGCTEWMYSPSRAEDIEAKFEQIRNDLLLAGENSLGSRKMPIEEARPGYNELYSGGKFRGQSPPVQFVPPATDSSSASVSSDSTDSACIEGNTR